MNNTPSTDQTGAISLRTGAKLGGCTSGSNAEVICEAKMTKDELIVKQQFEIEELKEAMKENKEACNTARLHLIHAEQWNSKCNEFPRVAMCAIINARDALENI